MHRGNLSYCVLLVFACPRPCCSLRRIYPVNRMVTISRIMMDWGEDHKIPMYREKLGTMSTPRRRFLAVACVDTDILNEMSHPDGDNIALSQLVTAMFLGEMNTDIENITSLYIHDLSFGCPESGCYLARAVSRTSFLVEFAQQRWALEKLMLSD